MKQGLKILGYVVSGLLAVLLIGPFFLPVSGARGTASAAELAAENGSFVEVGDLTVYTEQVGEGEPVIILLHGYGASVYSWRRVMPPLAEYGTVIAYDRPAFGFTERPLPAAWKGKANPYRGSSQPDLLVGLMDELGIEQAILVGHSAGGRAAVLTALSYPERVSALVLVDPALYGEMSPGWLQVLSGIPQVDRLAPFLVRSIQERGVEIIYRAWHNPALVTEDVIAAYKEPLQLASWDRALWEYSKVAGDAVVGNRLGELDLPVLVVTGEDDQVVPTEESVQAAEDIPGAQLAVFPDCGHVPNEECPEAFLDAVEPFLARVGVSH
ncbi:MAG: alpha/beta hydrolase [Anaerolineaceae bacterium]|jgi:pimeloyl-ACP methyl ester carboxylesterase|nr:alpha/beta hydrolase [Anaerolineaceae bacterium]